MNEDEQLSTKVTRLEGKFENIDVTVNAMKASQHGRDISINMINTNMAKITTDVDWIKRFFWLVASSSVTGVVMGVLNLIIALK